MYRLKVHRFDGTVRIMYLTPQQKDFASDIVRDFDGMYQGRKVVSPRYELSKL